MQEHQKRVCDEQVELGKKIEKLGEFTESPDFSRVEASEQQRLRKQLRIMADYHDILDERIIAFTS